MGQIVIPYSPHGKQRAIHDDPVRFKVIAAGRRSGKTILAVNELVKAALMNPATPGKPPPKSWYVCDYRSHAESIAWKVLLQFLPPEVIASQSRWRLYVELTNGHIIEFKGANDDPDQLRGVPLCFVVLDEYGQMKEEVWTEILRPSLMDTAGKALFIGTPSADGSPHFHELWSRGGMGVPDYKSWLFFTSDNPYIPKEEIAKAKRELPPDIFKREFEADFTVTAGLIYDNFKHPTHVVPNYEPTDTDFVVGSIDPGLQNPTGAILCAWKDNGEGVIFKEYYQDGLLAGENAQKIALMAKPYRVSYWVIDRSSIRRDMTNGISVLQKFQEHLRPVITAPNDPGSVWAGIDEVKKLFQPQPSSGRPKLTVSRQCTNWLWECGRYIRYKHKWAVEKNEEEKPRKLNDHLMDCTRNMVYTKPWMRRSISIYQPPNMPAY